MSALSSEFQVLKGPKNLSALRNSGVSAFQKFGIAGFHCIS